MSLKPGERCPTCGHLITKGKAKTERAATASRENGTKYGGRPINPDSARQRKLREKEEKQKQ